MNDKNFQTAKSSLAFSQGLVDRMRQQQMADMQMNTPMQDMPQEQTQPQEDTNTENTEPQVEEKTETKTIMETVKEAIAPIMEKLDSLISKSDKQKDVEIKIDGEMKPKEE